MLETEFYEWIRRFFDLLPYILIGLVLIIALINDHKGMSHGSHN